MAANNWGRIVNVASLFSFLTKVGRGPYSASKAGLLGMTRAAAVEWAKGGVLVNAISPGFIDTDLTRKNNTQEAINLIVGQIPIGRLARPSELFPLVRFLISEENTYITGQNFVIDGGFSIT